MLSRVILLLDFSAGALPEDAKQFIEDPSTTNITMASIQNNTSANSNGKSKNKGKDNNNNANDLKKSSRDRDSEDYSDSEDAEPVLDQRDYLDFITSQYGYGIKDDDDEEDDTKKNNNTSKS